MAAGSRRSPQGTAPCRSCQRHRNPTVSASGSGRGMSVGGKGRQEYWHGRRTADKSGACQIPRLFLHRFMKPWRMATRLKRENLHVAIVLRVKVAREFDAVLPHGTAAHFPENFSRMVSEGSCRDADRFTSQPAPGKGSEGNPEGFHGMAHRLVQRPAASFNKAMACGAGASQFCLDRLAKASTPHRTLRHGGPRDAKLLKAGRGPMDLKTGTGDHGSKVIQGNQVPANGIGGGFVTAVTSEVFPSDGTILEVDAAAQPLDLSQEPVVEISFASQVFVTGSRKI